MSRTAGPARAVCSGIVRFPFFIGYVQQSVTHADIKRQRKQKVSGGSRTRSLHVPGTNASNTKPRPLKIIFLPPLFQSVIHFSETVPSSVGLWLPSAPVVTETRSSHFSTLNRSRWSSVAILFKVWRQRLFLVRSSSIDLCFFFSF